MNELISHYQLSPHPEGGYYRETYRALTKLPGSARSMSTAIYYLLPQGQRSLLHKIGADEVWHFYLGDPLLVFELQPGGPKITRLGPDHRRGEQLQHVVPAGTWFGAMPDSARAKAGYSFVGCTVAPGFEFFDFELGDRDKLSSQFSECREAVLSLTQSTSS